jgi:hypothetical protein
MRPRILLFSCALAFPLVAHGQQTRINDVAWMQGCWEMVSSDRVVEEHWMSPRGGSMLGLGRTTKGVALVEFEFVVLRERGDRLAYEAHPSGQTPAVFLSRPQTGQTGPSAPPVDKVVFENLEHDFPQRVGYERTGADTLLAWIEGTRNGQVRRVEFPYHRSTCSPK